MRLLNAFPSFSPAVSGLYLSVVSTACASAMGIVVKLAGQRGGIPVMELVLARSLVLLCLSTFMLAREGRQAEWPWRSARRGLLLVRGVVGFAGVSCYYWAVQLLPMTDVAALSFLAPVLVAAAAPLVLGERAGRGVLLALPLRVVGVVLVAQPTFLFGTSAAAVSMLGVAVGIAQAAGSAGAKLCVRSLRTEAVSSVVFSMALVSTVGSAALCALLPDHFVVPPSAGIWALLLAAGLLACGVQFLATLSLKLSKATPAVAMSYFAVVWGLLADLALFHHKPSPVSLLGAALVCLSSLIIVVAEQRSSSSSVGSGSGSAAAAAAAESKQGVGTASNADGDKMLELAADGGSRQFDGKDGLAAADNAEERAPLAASAQRQPGGAM